MTMNPTQRKGLIRALVVALETVLTDVEHLGCTCGPGDENRFHAPSRRRKDSRCTGVRLAVRYRRLIYQGKREGR